MLIPLTTGVADAALGGVLPCGDPGLGVARHGRVRVRVAAPWRDAANSADHGCQRRVARGGSGATVACAATPGRHNPPRHRQRGGACRKRGDHCLGLGRRSAFRRAMAGYRGRCARRRAWHALPRLGGDHRRDNAARASTAMAPAACQPALASGFRDSGPAGTGQRVAGGVFVSGGTQRVRSGAVVGNRGFCGTCPAPDLRGGPGHLAGQCVRLAC